jgi:hypothetical protein
MQLLRLVDRCAVKCFGCKASQDRDPEIFLEAQNCSRGQTRTLGSFHSKECNCDCSAMAVQHNYEGRQTARRLRFRCPNQAGR